MRHLTACKISVNLPVLNRIKNEMIFSGISELMLATIIQRYDKKSFHFLSKSRTRDLLKFYRLSGATFYDCINTIYQFITPFLDNKMSIFEEYGAFKTNLCSQKVARSKHELKS